MSSRITIAGYEFLGPYPLGTFQAPNEAAIYLILKTSRAFSNNYEAYYVGYQRLSVCEVQGSQGLCTV